VAPIEVRLELLGEPLEDLWRRSAAGAIGIEQQQPLRGFHALLGRQLLTDTAGLVHVVIDAVVVVGVGIGIRSAVRIRSRRRRSGAHSGTTVLTARVGHRHVRVTLVRTGTHLRQGTAGRRHGDERMGFGQNQTATLRGQFAPSGWEAHESIDNGGRE
jgi:hypothetical protein